MKQLTDSEQARRNTFFHKCMEDGRQYKAQQYAPAEHEYKLDYIESGCDGWIAALRFRRKPRKDGKSQSPWTRPIYNRGETKKAAALAVWNDYIKLYMPTTCHHCGQAFDTQWDYYRHLEYVPEGAGYYAYEAGDYECPDAVEIEF